MELDVSFAWGVRGQDGFRIVAAHRVSDHEREGLAWK